MNDQPKSKRHWRWLRRGSIVLAVLATLAAILITEENWRGKHDWEAYKRAAEARGERLDVASVIPPPVPDDENFFCAPIVAETLQAERGSTTFIRDSASGKPLFALNPIPGQDATNRMNFNLWRGHLADWINQGGNWQKGTLTDLKQWQDGFRRLSITPEGKTNGFPVPAQPGTPSADVLFALSVFDPEVEELRQASQRPYMQIPLNYEDDFGCAQELLPWLAAMKSFTQFQELRILAEEQNHQGDQAMADVKLLVRVNDCIRKQPFLISQLVRMAIMAYVVQPIYEGLAQHCWSDAQLKELERTLAKEDFLADYQFAMRSEKIFAIDTIEKQRITRKMRSFAGDTRNQIIETNSLRWMPSAYFYQNELAIARMNEEFLRPLVDVTNHLVSPAVFRQVSVNAEKQLKHYSPYKIQALMTFPAISASVLRFATIQASMDLARVACALERYHLAHGEYPANLDALTPQYIEELPHDIINGQPLHYHRTDDGKFVLYSVGWNEKDDGGTIVLTKNGTVDRKNGDWVWQYPTK